jgi:hypothetical protein
VGGAAARPVEVVIAVGKAAEGSQFTRLTWLRPHMIRDLRARVSAAGLRSCVPFDVRMYRRPPTGAAPVSGAGWIVAVVGRVP